MIRRGFLALWFGALALLAQPIGCDGGQASANESHAPTPADHGGSQPLTTERYSWRNVAILGGGFVPGIIFNAKERNLMYARTDIGGGEAEAHRSIVPEVVGAGQLERVAAAGRVGADVQGQQHNGFLWPRRRPGQRQGCHGQLDCHQRHPRLGSMQCHQAVDRCRLIQHYPAL